ncbi:MAG TPA: B12-binding domain-containing protein [Solirubrobacteraceae bacterium]|nr:B12-binding domain-containing protein [Solirubrobacteraceae bacterium]
MQLRIGELSRRSGVSPELLRAWERRYGLLQPERTAGGLRLYSAADLERVREMQRHIGDGVAAREAADLAKQPPARTSREATGVSEAARGDLARATEAFDETAAQALIDELLARTTIDTLLSDVVIPFLRELGDRWERGEVSIAQEHFASNLLRGRLLGLARGWGRGTGPRALLACPEGEHHDLGLIAFGLALRERGWRIDYLGGNTPVTSIAEAAEAIQPDLLVLSAVAAEPLERLPPMTARRVAVAGAGARDIDADLVLTGDPVVEADRVTALLA